MAEFRVDPETLDWHLVAPQRADRPVDRSTTADDRCPFCPGHEALTPPEVLRVPVGAERWRVRVVPNLYGLVAPATEPAPAQGPAAQGPSAQPSALPATGQHEVVIESPGHDWDLHLATRREAMDLLWALRERCRALAEQGPAAIVVFRNHGKAAGTSLHHPHSQIVALDQAPPGLVRRWRNAHRAFLETGRCLHDAIAVAERADRSRVVEDADGVLVFQPRAAGVPHETVLLPGDDASDLAGASDHALGCVADTLPRVLAGLAAVRDDPPYNLVVHAGPTGDATARDWYRWHIALYPRVTLRAGLELATGLDVNPTAPEHTAPLLRRAVRAVPDIDAPAGPSD